MTWRLHKHDYEAAKGEGNRLAFKTLVKQGPPPGVIGYLNGRPVGWCAVGPRESFPRLANSRVLAPVDAKPVWSIVCLFLAKEHRGSGCSSILAEGATRFAFSNGAEIVEAYPFDPLTHLPDPFVWTGLLSTYTRIGFREVVRRSARRPIVRLMDAADLG